MLRRNEKCFCGSGKRFKHCHGALSIHRKGHTIENWYDVPQRVRDAFDQKQMARVRHYEKYGFHRPPLIAGVDGDRFILCGERLLRWKGAGGFLNFLEADLLQHMGESFNEISHHPINVWHKAIRNQAEERHRLGCRQNLVSTVAVINFFTVANDVFVLSDNAKLRDRLLKSLRVAQEFHGARYELMIASCLIRSGFSIEFSDEEDLTRKHIDAIAYHPKTDRRYFVEMKAKGRPGVLGKPGKSDSRTNMRRDVSRLLRDALAKPTDGERLIFIDMNLPPAPIPSQETGVWWQNDAVGSLHALREQRGNLSAETSGFVVFTNSPAHHMPLDEYYQGLEIAFTAFNDPEFGKGMPLLNDIHPEIADLFDAFRAHDLIPEEFTSEGVT